MIIRGAFTKLIHPRLRKLFELAYRRTGWTDAPIGPPPRRRYAPVDDWPPSPDDLNERWWEK